MTMIILLVVLLGLLHLIPPKWVPNPWSRVALKLAPMAALILIAFTFQAPLLALIALALCTLGDCLLQLHSDKPESEALFIGGLAAFLAGHIAYIALFFPAALFTGNAVPIIFLLMFALSMARLLWTEAGTLRAPVMGYIFAIFSMGVVTLSTGITPIVLGGLAFIASDTLLSFELFVLSKNSRHRHWTPFAVWGLYLTAQVLLTLSAIVVFSP